MGTRGAALLLLLGSACREDLQYLSTPWDRDRPLVVVIHEDGVGPQAAQLWSGEALELEMPAGRELYALSFPTETDPELALATCGVELGTRAPLLADPLEVYAFRAGDQGWRSLLGEQRPTIALSYQSCDPEPFACRNWKAQPFSGPTGFRSVDALAVIDDYSVFFVVHEGPESESSRLVHFDNVGMRILNPPGLVGPYLSISTFRDTVYGTTASLQRFRLDRDGELLEIATSTPGLDRVATGPDVRLVYGEAGLVSFEGTVGRLDEPVEQVAVIDAERVIVRTASAVQHWDGRRWNRVLMRRPDDRIEGVGGDREALLVVDDLGTVLLLDEATQRWEAREAFFGAARSLRAIVGLKRGRFLVVGRTGFLGLWDGQSTCSITPPQQRDYYFARPTPDGQVVYVLGRTDGQDLSAQLLRLDVPDE